MASVASSNASAGPHGFGTIANPSSDLRLTGVDMRLPVSVLTGFLGSGKTTVLNRLLAQASMRGCAVAINEFGEVEIDGDLVQHATSAKAVIAGGCFCCSLSATALGVELLTLYHRAAASDYPVDRLIIEMTGIGEPADLIGFVIGNPAASQLLRLETIVCTVDAAFAERYINEYPEAVAQIAIADVLLITKPDLATASGIAKLTRTITGINPRARVIFAKHGEVSADQLMLPQNRDAVSHTVPSPTANGAHSHRDGKSGHDVVTFTLDADWPLDRGSFSRWLTSVKVSSGRSLLRTKGVVYFKGEPKPFAIQGVQHVFETPTPLWHLAEDGFHSRLMFIAKNAIAEEIKPGWHTLVLDAAPSVRGRLRS